MKFSQYLKENEKDNVVYNIQYDPENKDHYFIIKSACEDALTNGLSFLRACKDALADNEVQWNDKAEQDCLKAAREVDEENKKEMGK